MRRLLLATLAFVASSGASFAQEKWPESSVTLALTLSRSGAFNYSPGKNSTTTRVAPLNQLRLGNRDILEALQAEGLIDSITGWRVVAIWAYWPDADPIVGVGFRFFARKGKGASLRTIPIPSTYLAISPRVAALGVRHTLFGETIVGGTENFTVYDDLRFDLAGHASVLSGLETGSGRYTINERERFVYYAPNTSKVVVQGTYSDDDLYAAGVVSGSLSFGPSKLVAKSDYVSP